VSMPELTGSFPTELGLLSYLEDADLYYNSGIAGWLPTEVGWLTSITEDFDIEGCNVTGTIPTELGNLVNLTTLWLSDNKFHGNVPSELGRLVSSSRIDLEVRQLTFKYIHAMFILHHRFTFSFILQRKTI